MIEVIGSYLHSLEKVSNVSPESLIIDAENIMNESKQKMYRVIDSYFEDKLNEYRKQVHSDLGPKFDFQKLIGDLKEVIAELKRIDYNLNTEDGLFQSIDRTISTSSEDLIIHYREETQRKLDSTLSLKLPISFEDSEVPAFRNDLAKYIRIINKKIVLPDQNKEMPSMDVISVKNEEIESYFRSKFK